MFALLDLVRLGANDAQSLTRSHGLWMAWNLVLALIPFGLALVLFPLGGRSVAAVPASRWARVVRRSTYGFGVVLFVLFLPNAPYVLTDVIHLFDDIRLSRSDLQILGVYLPVYLAFFGIGIAAYGASLHRVWRWVEPRRSVRVALGVEVGLHLLVALGVYLGRVLRLNSWHVFTRPRVVLGTLDALAGPFPIAMILISALTLAAVSLFWRVGDAGVRSLFGAGHLRAGRPRTVTPMPL